MLTIGGWAIPTNGSISGYGALK
jgi:hypothetical protein